MKQIKKYNVTGQINLLVTSYNIKFDVRAGNKAEARISAYLKLKKRDEFKNIPSGVLMNKVRDLWFRREE